MTKAVSASEILDALKQTHMHVIGSSGYGKSKFLEWLMRHLTKSTDAGFCLVDWHGTLYQDVLRYLAGTGFSSRPVYILDPSAGRFITGFNPFSSTDGDMSAQVSRRIDATVKPWGATSTDETPLLSRMLRMLYSFAAESHETLPNAYLMFNAKNANIRQYAATLVKDGYMQQQIAEFAKMSDSDVRRDTASSMNRLDRFLAPTAIRRMLGRQSGNLSIRQILDDNGILIVNLAASRSLTNESSKLIAALLMNEFREAALDRAGTKKRFFLFLDEFQEYMTHDISAMLDQVRKGGLNLVLSHQHLAQLGDDESLQSSIATNARIKAVFGGLDYETAVMVANEIRLKTINRRQVERQIYGHTVLGHFVETYINKGTSNTASESTSDAENSGQTGTFDEDDKQEVTGWNESGGKTTTSSESNTTSSTETRMLIPVDGKELKSEQAVPHEEKIAREAFNIMTMRPRELYLKLPSMAQAIWQRVPEVRTRGVFPETLKTYEEKAFARSGAKPPEEIDKFMAESRDAFLLTALNYSATLKAKSGNGEDTPAEGRAKKPPRPRST